jgi:MOSC domain-containing protein YiiM
MSMHLHSVNLGQIRRLRINGRDVATAIGKQPTRERVQVGPLGLDGDEQADPTVHGGLRKAIYAYNWDHYGFWRTVRAQAKVSLWDEELPAGLMGENLTIPGLDEAQLWIGDRLVLPDCVLVVSEPRMPCGKFNAVMGFNQASRLMNQSGYCGTYLAVLQPGTLQVGETIRLEPGPRELQLRELFRSRIRPGRD